MNEIHKNGSVIVKAPVLIDFEDEDLVSQVVREVLSEDLIEIKLRNKKE
jgi:hypothetical protein